MPALCQDCYIPSVGAEFSDDRDPVHLCSLHAACATLPPLVEAARECARNLLALADHDGVGPHASGEILEIAESLESSLLAAEKALKGGA